jgi:hypothetical protein
MNLHKSVCRPSLEQLEGRDVPSTTVANFSDGAWRWDSSAGWTHLSSQSATQFSVDDSGNVFGQFADGLWRWSASSMSWMKLSDGMSSNIQTTGSGILYGDFGSAGLWRWDPGSGWMKLTADDPGLSVVSATGAYFATFTSGPMGTWRWTATQGWGMVSGGTATSLQTDDTGAMVGQFGTETWRWSPTTGWDRISTMGGMVEVSSNGNIFEQRSDGIFLAFAGNNFVLTRISTTMNAELMALPSGNLFLEVHPSGGGHSTSWLFTSSTVSWMLVDNDAADDRGVDAGNDNDQFIDRGTDGLWHRSADGQVVQLTNRSFMNLTTQDT